ncbi:hypothetical protein HNQ03_002763 [Chryseobacterium sp. 16F]|uniref:DUF4836 family protein n=2 Tax=Frigoriflavimonas asaccharolytica TaxID=2735899 RepID=A0A8J8GBU7_9FLAO|nr:hypothetical protein [Frigoriflavimonas asaccharolytica]
MKIPSDAVFYMEINGKQLDKKLNWEKLTPFMKELTENKNGKASWNDFAKTGIKYDATQFHYATINDSVKSYTTYFVIDNKAKFQEFINSSKKEGLEISKKSKYSYVNFSDEMSVAWNGNRAALSIISYSKPNKDNIFGDDDYAVDSTSVMEDEAYAMVDSAYVDAPFNYKYEIDQLKENIKYLKDNIKDNKKSIAQTKKDIRYLKKHKQYPGDREAIDDKEYGASEEAYTEEEENYSEEDIAYEKEYQKELDSIQRENFKMVKILSVKKFDEFFNSNLEIEVPKEMIAFRDAKSDVFVYTDYGKILNEGIYGKLMNMNDFGGLFMKMYNSNSSYNLYFDNDKVRLVNNYQHKDAKIQKGISDIYNGKVNEKLAALINDENIGYYSMNLNGSKYFDLMYGFVQDAGDMEYQKEMQLIMETMKIILDEEAISKIAPGNGIFVLNELKNKTVKYTEYIYDEDSYDEKEVEKTKEIAVPNFTFAFATENEGYWNRVFNLLITNKNLKKKFTKNGDVYAFKNEKSNDVIDNMYFTVKDGIVYMTTSIENLTPKNQTIASKNWAKESSQYAMSGRLDMQKLITGLDNELKTGSDVKTINAIKKNIGELHFKTEAKGESIQTEMNYKIKNSSENSLMYFFDLFEEIYKINEAEKKPVIM